MTKTLSLINDGGGVNTMFQQIADFIILLAALGAAIYKIWDFFAKPTSKLKKLIEEKKKARIKEVLDAELPKILKKHDLEVRDKYKSDRQKYLEEIKEQVLEEVSEPIMQNTDDLEALKISARDVLREKIMGIYHHNRRERSMTEYEKEALTQYYKDYKALNGNSYIDKYYARMTRWQIIYDDCADEDE